MLTCERTLLRQGCLCLMRDVSSFTTIEHFPKERSGRFHPKVRGAVEMQRGLPGTHLGRWAGDDCFAKWQRRLGSSGSETGGKQWLARKLAASARARAEVVASSAAVRHRRRRWNSVHAS